LRRDTELPLEVPRQVALVAESGDGRDLRDRLSIVPQQVVSTVQPSLQEILVRGDAKAGAEQVAEVGSADACDVPQGDQGQVVAEMLLDEFLDVSHLHTV
jgi:hypothetical protein